MLAALWASLARSLCERGGNLSEISEIETAIAAPKHRKSTIVHFYRRR